MIKRISLVAGYDGSGVVHEYVVYLLRALATFSDVHYFCDGALLPGEAEKLHGIATLCGARRHGRHDFGSWAEMVAMLGWARLSAYDEMIVANDSVYGPFTDLAPICDAMSRDACDFWGMTANVEQAYHLQSYFLVFKKRVLQSPVFQAFWQGIEAETSHGAIVTKYEVGLSLRLRDAGFRPQAYIRSRAGENLTTFPLTLLRAHGMPFVKVKCFTSTYLGNRERVSLLFRFLRQRHPAMAQMIARHQGKGFLSRSMRAQRIDQPIYANFGPIRLRSIRNNRIKILLFGRWRIIVPLGAAGMRRLSRWPCLRIKI